MPDSIKKSSDKQIAIWLLIGVAMIIIQTMLGGITRLTESGLSITEWKPLTGVLPPLNIIEWQTEFDKYKHTDQFRFIHADFSLKDFKFIFFLGMVSSLVGKAFGCCVFNRFCLFFNKKKI
jgi:cytochrome c oxidase assembly protein subunit 15